MNSPIWSGSYSLRSYRGLRRADRVWRTGRSSTGWSTRSGPGSPDVTCRNARSVEDGLHPLPPLCTGRRVHPRSPADPGPRRRGRRHRLARPDRLHRRPRPPARRRHRPKKGIHRPDEPDDHALGRSRGGLTTRVHLACDGKGRPLAILLTPGRRHDSVCARSLLERIRVLRTGLGRPRSTPDRVVADKAYSSRGLLESGIAGVLVRLSALELARPNGLRPVFTNGEVDRPMRTAHRIRRLGDGVTVDGRTTDVAIEIARDVDGSVVVFPALSVVS